jgi:hypothetical protein
MLNISNYQIYLQTIFSLTAFTTCLTLCLHYIVDAVVNVYELDLGIPLLPVVANVFNTPVCV